MGATARSAEDRGDRGDMPRPGEVGVLETLSGEHTIVGSPAAEKHALARAQSYNYVTGGLCGGLMLLLPHPGAWDAAALIPFAPFSVLVGMGLYRYADRMPTWLLATTPALATLMTGAVVALSGTAVSAFAMFYLWVGFYAVYFLPRAVAVAQIGFIVLNYAAIWLLVGAPAEAAEAGVAADVPYFVIAIATVVMAGLLLHYLRRRLGLLVGTLAGAAQTDLLTGLPNSRSFRRTLEGELERAGLSRRPVSVVLCDVDRLRGLNEALGHDGADRLLREIADAIVDSTRGIDTVARVGPGTFGVALPELDDQDALILAEELLSGVRRGFRAEGRPAVTISVGAATFPRDAGDVAGLLGRADRALDAAKVLGRDRVVVASPKLDEILSGGPRRSVGDSVDHLKMLVSLAEALDLRDSGIADHVQRVGALCERIARELGMPEPRVARARLAGILHDIGKIGVPDAILFKPGPLDEDEWRQVRRHPEMGVRILGSSEFADIREWVLASHERLDGSGYPRGLSGDEIPLEARIISVADAYDTMTSGRSYRAAVSDDAARDELRRCSGRAFDPEVVEALAAVLDREAEAAASMQ